MADTIQKTVYFLGAGASAASDFHLPMMKNIFRKEDFTGEEYQNLKLFIDNKFDDQPLEDLNLEEVVTAIELSLDTFGSLGKHPEPYIYEARTELNKYVANRLEIDTTKGCTKLEKIITSQMASRSSADSVITLNYDLVIDTLIKKHIPEEAKNKLGRLHDLLGTNLRAIGGPVVTYEAESPTSYSQDLNIGFYLKLHGSINWLYCPNPNCGHHQIFFPNQNMVGKPGDFCTLCGMPFVSVIVPPTMYKTFEKFPKMGFLWSLAYRELNAADRIVIFGVSFAQSDYYLRWLFKKAITDRDRENKPTLININIDKKSGVCDKIKEITGIVPEHFQKLDEYLAK